MSKAKLKKHLIKKTKVRIIDIHFLNFTMHVMKPMNIWIFYVILFLKLILKSQIKSIILLFSSQRVSQNTVI